MGFDTTGLPLADRRIPAGGDWLSAEELAGLTNAELARRMRALQPQIAAAAAEAERLRRPVDEIWQALRRAGYFYQFVPKAFGGLEASPDEFIDATLPIAEACASTAWAASFCAEHNWIVSHFPVETQRALFGGDYPYVVAPGVTAPPGTATPVEGGYRVTGRWKWGTGVMHADWIIATVLVPRDGGVHEARMVLFPAAEASVIDTWHVDGMIGTGSNDVAVADLFVPEAFTVISAPLRCGRGPGSRAYNNPIYSAPMLPFLTMTAAMPALGAARGALAAFRDRLTGHVRMGNQIRQADRPATQIRLARADVMITSAEQIVRKAGRDAVALGRLDEPEQTPGRLEVRARLAYAVSLCREAVSHLAESAGSAVHMLDQPFQRALRDLSVLSTHVVFDLDTAMELHGRAIVGLPPNAVLT